MAFRMAAIVSWTAGHAGQLYIERPHGSLAQHPRFQEPDSEVLELMQQQLGVNHRQRSALSAASPGERSVAAPTDKMEHPSEWIAAPLTPYRATLAHEAPDDDGDPFKRMRVASRARLQLDRVRAKLWAVVRRVFIHPDMPTHPFPDFDWAALDPYHTGICCIVLFLSAILCSAGGIGGGGVYVTVLMTAGVQSPHEAVPLSKTTVFIGSVATLVLNVRKALMMSANGQVLIDYNICRVVVPSCLLGTLLGVLLNSLVAPWVIVVLLSLILFVTLGMSTKKWVEQYQAEQWGISADGAQGRTERGTAETSPAGKESIRGILRQGEGFGWFLLLLVVVTFGVVRYHFTICHDDLVADPQDEYGRGACMRPVIRAFVGPNNLENLMSDSTRSQLLIALALGLPTTICLATLLSYSVALVGQEGWHPATVVAYSAMGLFTGCFAGLVGIGGGLIFSPFYLWMGIDPSIAVATSSTCVIFTSSSTTFQYLLTDRINVAMALVYGVVGGVASYTGTRLVHYLQDSFNARPSLITAIVCMGVLASVVLSVYKLCLIGAPVH